MNFKPKNDVVPIEGVKGEEEVVLPITEMSEADVEDEAARTSGSNEDKKVTIDPDLSNQEIMEKYNVSRTTAWRAKKRGYLLLNYHVREIDVDNEWAEKNIEVLKKNAEHGAFNALDMHKLRLNSIAPFEKGDLISIGLMRLIELSGHPGRESGTWQSKVARNAVLTFLDKEVFNRNKVFDHNVVLDSNGQLEQNFPDN